MPNINLLPWREKLRETRKKHFIGVWISCLVLTGVTMLGVHAAIAYQIKSQKYTNEFLTHEIAQLDIKIAAVETIKKERENLLSRMNVILQLQAGRPLNVKIFDTLARFMTDGLYLSELSRTGQSFSVKGKAESNTSVSELMRAIEQSAYFTNPILTEIKSDKTERVYKSIFELTCLQKTT